MKFFGQKRVVQGSETEQCLVLLGKRDIWLDIRVVGMPKNVNKRKERLQKLTHSLSHQARGWKVPVKSTTNSTQEYCWKNIPKRVKNTARSKKPEKRKDGFQKTCSEKENIIFLNKTLFYGVFIQGEWSLCFYRCVFTLLTKAFRKYTHHISPFFLRRLVTHIYMCILEQLFFLLLQNNSLRMCILSYIIALICFVFNIDIFWYISVE